MIDLKSIFRIPPVLKRGRWLRIKLSTLALIVGAAALVASAVLGVMYFQQQREQESLASQLAVGRESLTEYDSAASLEERLAAVEARLIAEQAYFPDKLSSEATLTSILQIAQESQVTVVEISTQPERDQERGNHTYSALSVYLQVTGGLPELQDFVNKLEKGELKAVSIDEIGITGMEESPVVSLDFSVWARR